MEHQRLASFMVENLASGSGITGKGHICTLAKLEDLSICIVEVPTLRVLNFLRNEVGLKGGRD